MKNINIPFETIAELATYIDGNEFDVVDSLLIQVFCVDTDVVFIRQLQSLIQEKLPKAVLIGTTTDGVINSTEVYVKSKSVATFSLFSKTTLRSKLIQYDECAGYSYAAGEELAKSLSHEELRGIICFADGLFTNGDNLLDGIQKVSPDVFVAGGLAGDNGRLQETFVFDNHTVTSRGVVGVGLVNKNLFIETGYNFNWLPIGKKMVVTKAVKNRVYELDEIPVVDVYAKYMGKELADLLPKVGIEFPLIFEKNGVFVGRAPIVKHDDGSLTFAGNVQEGEVVRFGIGDMHAILSNGAYQISEHAQKLKYKPEALFVYSCMARRRFLGEYISKELESLNTLAQTSGFFTYGEFFHRQQKNQMLNETMTYVAISENKIINESIEKIKHITQVEKKSMTTQHALAHLANMVSNELLELNENLEQIVEEKTAYIYKQLYYDELTGLPNRLSLIKRMKNYTNHYVVLIDIDRFSVINDFYGYKVADNVLKDVAKILEHYVQKNDAQAYKLPADEYALVVPIPKSKKEQEEQIKAIVKTVEGSGYEYKGCDIHIGITLGIASIGGEKIALQNADMALKLAKLTRKGFVVFNKELQLAQQYEKNIKTAMLIKIALKNDNIIPFFQPIVDVETLEIVKYESLVRLKTQEQEILSPYTFLDASRKIKLYEEITKIMIERSFRFFAQNGKDFSINLSYEDIADPNLKQFLFERMDHYKIAKQLTIEILETEAFEDSEKVVLFAKELHAHGAKIAIDDFGSGYANFEYITKIPSNFVKIDGSLIKYLNTDQNARIITETIVSFAKKMNKKVIAEFVHSKEVFAVVQELGIEYAQGYYFSEPKEAL